MKVFTSESFQTEVLHAKMPVLVEFSAEWCGPCKMMASALEALSVEFAGKMEIGTLDVEDGGEIAMKYGIMNVPTILIFQNGKAVKRLNGLQKLNDLKKKLEDVLS